MKFLVEINLDGHDTEEEHQEACRILLEDLSSSGACVSFTEDRGDLWLEYDVKVESELFNYTVCGLCGNHGTINMSGLKTPKGDDVPAIQMPCICPNGRR